MEQGERGGGRFLWGAIAAGPLVWFALYLLLLPDIDLLLPLGEWRRLLVLIILYPVLEEWLFRGLIQGWMLESAWGRRSRFGISLANTATSLLFVVAHLLIRGGLFPLLIFFPSLMFGLMRERYNSVVPAVALHSYYNAGFFLIFWSSFG